MSGIVKENKLFYLLFNYKIIIILKTGKAIRRAMVGSYAYFPKALLRLSPSGVMTRQWVFLYRQLNRNPLSENIFESR